MEIAFVASIVVNTLLTSVSIYCAFRTEKKSDLCGLYVARFAEISSAIRQLDDDMDDVYDRLKRASARKGMRAMRDERSDNPYAKLPSETDGEWKARARKLRNNGIEPKTES